MVPGAYGMEALFGPRSITVHGGQVITVDFSISVALY
jgi:hypothetical protein